MTQPASHASKQQEQVSNFSCEAVYDGMATLPRSIIAALAQKASEQKRWADFLALMQQEVHFIQTLQSPANKVTALQSVAEFMTWATNDPAFSLELGPVAEPILASAIAQMTALGPMPDSSKVSILTKLALVYHTIGQSEPSNEILEQAALELPTISEASRRAAALVTLIEAYEALGATDQAMVRLDEAVAIAQRIVTTSEAPDAQEEIIGRIINCYANLGNFSTAIALTQSLRNTYLQGYAYDAIVLHPCWSNREGGSGIC